MGLLHIYCGDGKGKTTASVGLAVRAVGAGMKVAFVQLMKGSDTSEINSLSLIPLIEISRCDRNYGFYRSMSDDDKKDITECHNRLIENAFSGEYDVIILDEFFSAYRYGLLDKATSEKLIKDSLSHSEIILTGRDPDSKFTDIADYISEIKCVRHPYSKGINARKGIEY